jgi:serine/threonine protein kinase
LTQEIDIGRSVKHENVCGLFSIYEEDELVHLVMEYVEGETLLAVLLASGELFETRAAKLTKQLLGAIQYLHELEIVHRDLKPENLIVDKQGNLKIIDFGLAATPANPCEKGTILGSPCYIAPEILNGKKYGAQVDLFSVGSIVYTVLYNRLPFRG